MAYSSNKQPTSKIETPNVFLSNAYFVASSRARLATPTAPIATCENTVTGNARWNRATRQLAENQAATVISIFTKKMQML